MLHEIIPSVPASESVFDEAPRSVWVHYPKHLLDEPEVGPKRQQDDPRGKSDSPVHENAGITTLPNEERDKQDSAYPPGHSLFQETFFFCTVKRVGDVPAAGCIYVETVVDRDSGVAFAKVYSARNAANAVDILTTRVMPFFMREGVAIMEIHTRRSSEYCGILMAHAFETFLASSHIRHLPMDQPGVPHIHVCEKFYGLLLKKFFPVALRKTFRLSLNELQKDLDTFVEAHNAQQKKPENEMSGVPHPSANFPVDV